MTLAVSLKSLVHHTTGQFGPQTGHTWKTRALPSFFRKNLIFLRKITSGTMHFPFLPIHPA